MTLSIHIESPCGSNISGTVQDEAGNILYRANRFVDSCAGIGGYDLGEVEDAKRELKDELEAWVKGRDHNLCKRSPKEGPESRRFLQKFYNLLRADHWGDIDSEWFNPESEDSDAVELHRLVEKLLD